MAGYFGSDFDPTQPTDGSPRRQGASVFRDIKQRLKTFLGALFDLETGLLKSGVVPVTALPDVVGLTPGQYTRFTVNSKGTITLADTPTTLSGYSITDALSTGTAVLTTQGGTGTDVGPSAGQIPIGTGDGTASSTWATITSGDGSITVNATAGSIDIRSVAASVIPFVSTVRVPIGSGPVTIIAGVSGKQVYVSDLRMSVSGASAWVGTGVVVQVQDTQVVPVNYVGAPVAVLTANAYVVPSTSGVVLSDPFKQGTPTVAGQGLQVAITGGTATSGSDVYVTVWGVLK